MSMFAVLLVFAVMGGLGYALHLVRRARTGDGGIGDVASRQRRYLAENWSAVELAATRGGMSPEELAEVRKRVLGT